METAPLLTIAIPTYNRANYLKDTLRQLQLEVEAHQINDIEILVSDNASSDETEQVVEEFQASGFDVRYVLNLDNVGSDANIAQCFNLAKSHYVLILGDDDLLYDGSLEWLMTVLESREYGVVCMRAFGFDNDFRVEYPKTGGSDQTFDDAGRFLVAIGPLLTLISACVINKDCLSDLDADDFCGSNLVQVHLVLNAALRKEKSLYSSHYHVGCQRNNSGGYDYIQIFVERLGVILDTYEERGLSRESIVAFELRMLLSHLPFYLLKQRFEYLGDQHANRLRLRARHGKSIALWLFLVPIMVLPRYLAIAWGAGVTLIGRIFYGDFRRGLYFFKSKVR